MSRAPSRVRVPLPHASWQALTRFDLRTTSLLRRRKYSPRALRIAELLPAAKPRLTGWRSVCLKRAPVVAASHCRRTVSVSSVLPLSTMISSVRASHSGPTLASKLRRKSLRRWLWFQVRMMALTTGVSDTPSIRTLRRGPPPIHADGSRKGPDRRNQPQAPQSLAIAARQQRAVGRAEVPQEAELLPVKGTLRLVKGGRAAGMKPERADAGVDPAHGRRAGHAQPEVPIAELPQPGIERRGTQRGLSPHQHEGRLPHDVGGEIALTGERLSHEIDSPHRLARSGVKGFQEIGVDGRGRLHRSAPAGHERPASEGKARLRLGLERDHQPLEGVGSQQVVLEEQLHVLAPRELEAAVPVRRQPEPPAIAVNLDPGVAQLAHDVEGPVRRGIVEHEQLEVSVTLRENTLQGFGHERLPVPGGHADAHARSV